MMYSSYFPFHFFGFGPVIMILFWGLVIWGIVILIRYSVGSSSPLSALKKRYAKGEITREEFEKIQKDTK